MAGYIDNYRLDLSPTVQALKERMQDRKNQREESMKAFTDVAKLMGSVADSSIRKSDQEQAEIKQLISSDDGITRDELIALYPGQAEFINGLSEKMLKSNAISQRTVPFGMSSDEASVDAANKMEGYKPNTEGEKMLGYEPGDLDLRGKIVRSRQPGEFADYSPVSREEIYGTANTGILNELLGTPSSGITVPFITVNPEGTDPYDTNVDPSFYANGDPEGYFASFAMTGYKPHNGRY